MRVFSVVDLYTLDANFDTLICGDCQHWTLFQKLTIDIEIYSIELSVELGTFPSVSLHPYVNGTFQKLPSNANGIFKVLVAAFFSLNPKFHELFSPWIKAHVESLVFSSVQLNAISCYQNFFSRNSRNDSNLLFIHITKHTYMYIRIQNIYGKRTRNDSNICSHLNAHLL